MSPSPNGRWTCTPRFMSSIETVPRCGGELAHRVGRVALAGDDAVPGVERQAAARGCRAPPNRPPSRSACRAPAPAPRPCPAPRPGAPPAAAPSRSQARACAVVHARLRHAGPERHRLRPSLGRDLERAGAGTRRGAPARPGRRVTRVGSCLARGSSRKRAPVSTTQPSPSCRSRAATRGAAAPGNPARTGRGGGCRASAPRRHSRRRRSAPSASSSRWLAAPLVL